MNFAELTSGLAFWTHSDIECEVFCWRNGSREVRSTSITMCHNRTSQIPVSTKSAPLDQSGPKSPLPPNRYRSVRLSWRSGTASNYTYRNLNRLRCIGPFSPKQDGDSEIGTEIGLISLESVHPLSRP